MATISKRGDYQFRAQIRRKGYPIVYKTFTDLAKAEAWAKDVESQMDQGIYQENTQANAITIEDLANEEEQWTRYWSTVLELDKRNIIEDLPKNCIDINNPSKKV